MPSYYIRPRAALDLDQIREYISEDNPAAAVRMMERVTDAFRQLADPYP